MPFWIFFRPDREDLLHWRVERNVAKLRQSLSVQSVEVRALAAEYLGQLQDRASVPALTRCWERAQEDTVRHAVVRALCQLGIDAQTTLLRVLRRERVKVARAEAAEALGNIASPEAIRALEETLLCDRSMTVRTAAAKALGTAGAAPSASLLASMLLAGHPLLTEAAAKSLQQLTAEVIIPTEARCAFRVGLQQFHEAVVLGAAEATRLMLLRAAISRDGSALPSGLLEALCEAADPQSELFLHLRLQTLQRTLSGGVSGEHARELRREAEMLAEALSQIAEKHPTSSS